MKKMTLLLCLAALIVPASAQHFKQVTGFTGSMQLVAAGRNEVWGINTSGQVFRLAAGKFVSVPGSLSQIAVGGGTGAVWGINNNFELFAFNFSTGLFQDTGLECLFVSVGANNVWAIDTTSSIVSIGAFGGSYVKQNVPGSLRQIAAGGDGVWGINSNQNIFRFDADTGNFLNIPGFLAQIAVGSGAGVWGVSPNSGDVFTFVRP